MKRIEIGISLAAEGDIGGGSIVLTQKPDENGLYRERGGDPSDTPLPALQRGLGEGDIAPKQKGEIPFEIKSFWPARQSMRQSGSVPTTEPSGTTPTNSVRFPPASPGSTSTRALWVRYVHERVNAIVVARGKFNHKDRTWIARYLPEGAGDRVSRVEALEWAEIDEGVRPWNGPIIPKRLKEAQ